MSSPETSEVYLQAPSNTIVGAVIRTSQLLDFATALNELCFHFIFGAVVLERHGRETGDGLGAFEGWNADVELVGAPACAVVLDVLACQPEHGVP